MHFTLLLAPLAIVASVAAAPVSTPAPAPAPAPDSAHAAVHKTKPVKRYHLIWLDGKYKDHKGQILKGDAAPFKAWHEWCGDWVKIKAGANAVSKESYSENVFIEKWPSPKNFPIWRVRCVLPIPGGEPLDVALDLASTLKAYLVDYKLRPYHIPDPSFSNTIGLTH